MVVELTEKYFNSKIRTVTADNFFSSISLADYLFQKKIRYIGTMKKNKTEIPWQFQPNNKREIFSSLFGFKAEKTLVSYVPKYNNAVILVSTEHHEKKTATFVKHAKMYTVLITVKE